MDAFVTWLRINVLEWIAPPKHIEIIDIVQIFLIAYFVYHLILWVKNTRAYALLKGIIFILAFVVIAIILRMDVIVWVMSNLSVAAITAVVIIFQPELRKVLEQVGHKNFFQSIFKGVRSEDDNIRFSDTVINELVHASFDMAEVHTGALIVLERDVILDEYENTGIEVDGKLTSQLLINIFEKNTPLHDGAVIVRNDRVAAATCYLPLSENMDLNKSLGTRHRAGIGISEVTDSLTIIVSEETGGVSYAIEGGLHKVFTPNELREELHNIQKIHNSNNRIKRRRQKKADEKETA